LFAKSCTAVGLLLLLAGCQHDLEVVKKPCQGDGQCADGQQCISGFCTNVPMDMALERPADLPLPDLPGSDLPLPDQPLPDLPLPDAPPPDLLLPDTGLCGNGKVDPGEYGEQCDGTNFNGKTCATFGYAKGKLSCKADCSAIIVYGCYN